LIVDAILHQALNYPASSIHLITVNKAYLHQISIMKPVVLLLSVFAALAVAVPIADPNPKPIAPITEVDEISDVLYAKWTDP